MKLSMARTIGMEVVEAMAPGCDRVMIAGSVRRGKAEVKDIEIVYISRMVEEQVDLFNVAEMPATEGLIGDLVRNGFWHFDDQVKRNGPLHKRLVRPIYNSPGVGVPRVVIELFRAVIENWGLILALRTGPADFNRLLVTRLTGAMPADMQMRGGFLWRRGQRLETPTEEIFFEEIGVPCWAPEERSAARLARWLWERGRGEGEEEEEGV